MGRLFRGVPHRRGRVDLVRAQMPLEKPTRGVPIGEDDTGLIREELARRNARIAAESVELIARGRATVLDLNGFVDNVVGAGQILSFTVPTGKVAVLRALAIVYSEPALVDLSQVTLLVSGSGLPYVLDIAAFQLVVCGSLSEPFEISEVYVQSTETVSVNIVNGGTIRYRCSVRVMGDMHTPRLGGV